MHRQHRYHSPHKNILVFAEKDKSLQTTITIFVPTILVVVVLLIFISIYFRRKKARKILLFDDEDNDEIKTVESLQFNLDTIQVATSNFSAFNKLGKGGFGICLSDPTKKAQLDWEKRYKIIRVKSDVFSFGKLVLEIVSGQKNYGSSLGENGEVLLSFAWRNWQEGTITNIIDPSLNNYSQNEMIRCIQIGLLCSRKFSQQTNHDYCSTHA
ncbi:putative receptor-like protein kinase At4g00960 isoform X1 [Glycine soja]|uniref:putative receptor-like protein kinase At4g00960 isoform X1 n=1 Tax=Glycine soja TaxID=3848 RepID=UPI00103BBD54|nr:putative receptor-like protein kinase At4g00960 isoform X1 [Glycine soja]